MSDNICDRCYRKPYYCDIRAHGSGGGTISCTSFHPQTHADRIRAMSDEELAEKFEEIQIQAARAYGNDTLLLEGELRKFWLDWLKQEVEE